MSLIIIHLRIASLTPKENNPHKKKCKHNPIGDAAVEMYLSGLEEEILFLDKEEKEYDKGGRIDLYLLRDDFFIISKEADKGLVI